MQRTSPRLTRLKDRRRKKLAWEAIVAIILALAGWIYTAGQMSARLDSQGQRLDRIEEKLDRLVERAVK